MARRGFVLSFIILGLASFITIHAYSSKSFNYYDHDRAIQMRKLQQVFQRESTSVPSPSPSVGQSPRVYKVTSYGADPTGKTDSTDAILRAISDAVESGDSDGGFMMMQGIVNLGGVTISLEGGFYKITRPLKLPVAGLGNLMIRGGTLKASDDFPTDSYLIDLSAPSSSKNNGYNYEYITFEDLMLDSNYRGGGIQVINSLRTSIDNCYIAHFTTNGILVQSGHETYIRNSFLGQHITAGGDSGERNFTGTAINLMGNDNAVTDVVIFSASVGILISGQANILSGVHCYNKATGFGGTGIYIKTPGLTQTRIVNSYLDYTGIVAEDPVQLHVSNCFFLGDAYIVLKSVNGVVNGINIVDNMFSGSNNGIDIVQLDKRNGEFKEIDQVVVDRNNARGMNVKATVAKGTMEGNGSSWTVDFNSILLFPRLINHVQYTLRSNGTSFPNYALRNVSENRVVIESDVKVRAIVFVMVDQGRSNRQGMGKGRASMKETKTSSSQNMLEGKKVHLVLPMEIPPRIFVRVGGLIQTVTVVVVSFLKTFMYRFYGHYVWLAIVWYLVYELCLYNSASGKLGATYL